MQNSMCKKGLVFGIIALFVGAGVVPSMEITSVEKERRLTDDVVSSEMHRFDVHQPVNPTLVFKSRTDWNYNWSYYKKITINHTMVDDNLTNFPVLIVNTSSDFSDHAQPDGDDFVFVDETNTTQYNHEIEYYDNTTGELIVWVNVTSLSSIDDTIIWLYYGNNNCSSQENVEDVWDSNYTAVWHMNDNTTSTITDSTSNNHNGNKKAGGEPVESTGLAGYGQLFDGANDYIGIEDSQDWNISSGNLTIELWLKNTDAGDTCTYFAGQSIGGNGYWIPQIYTGYIGWGHTGGNKHCGAFTPAQSEWYYLVWQISGGTGLTCYVNATDYGSNTIIEIGNNTDPLCIGTCYVGGSTHTVDGILDEIRFSNVARNLSWIHASYHTQNQTIGFLIIGDEELSNIPPIANFTYTPTNPIQKETIQFNDTSVDPDGNITTWQWDFGDGNTSNETNPTHTYGDWGNYTVTLNVTDDFGATNETSQVVFVANSKPIANFTYSPQYPIINETIYFTDNSTDIDGIIVAWYWDFDDGYSSTLQNPIHEYSNEGTYNVTLTVTDDDGATDTYQIAIVVTQPNNPPTTPVIDGPTSGKAGTSYDYNFSATDPNQDQVEYYIEWGDGNYENWFGPFDSGDPQSKSHTWQKKDTYTIRCKARDTDGNESDWGTLEVTMPKNKAFNFNFNLLSWLFERFPNAFLVLRSLLVGL